MTIKSAIGRQFGRPTGAAGWLAGQIMARRPSNRERNRRTVELMALEPHHHVLEIGCGPGLALEDCARVVTGGRIVALDHSDTMITQAWERLERAGLTRRVELVSGGTEHLVQWSAVFHRVFSLNVIQFVADKPALFRAIHRSLAPGGMVFTTYQPRLEADGTGAAARMARELRDVLWSIGFVDLAEHRVTDGDPPAICVSARRAA